MIDAVGGIDKQLVEKAAGAAPEKRSVLRKLALPVAACLALALGARLAYPRLAAPVPGPESSESHLVAETGDRETQEGPSTEEKQELSAEGPGSKTEEAHAHGEQSGANMPVNLPGQTVEDPAQPGFLPDNSERPEDLLTMISNFGDGTYPEEDKTVENGKAGFSPALMDAMEYYGDSVLYQVYLTIFRDGVQIPVTDEVVRRDRERLCSLGYVVVFETMTKTVERDGLSIAENEYSLSLHTTWELLSSFDPGDELGYYLELYGEHFEGAGAGTGYNGVVFNSNDPVSSSPDLPVPESSSNEED
jgi:hypothetical protein